MDSCNNPGICSVSSLSGCSFFKPEQLKFSTALEAGVIISVFAHHSQRPVANKKESGIAFSKSLLVRKNKIQQQFKRFLFLVLVELSESKTQTCSF